MALWLASGTLAQANEDIFSFDTRFGTLKMAPDSQLLHNGRALSPRIIVPSPASVISIHRLASADVFLIAQPTSADCPGKYVFLTITAAGSKVGKPFGTCYDDYPRPMQKGETIILLLRRADGSGVNQYFYENGAVREVHRPSQQ
jgi:hypothetical protein